MTEPRFKWAIRINGYGTFEYEGSESQAEKVRADKARWEAGSGMKWRLTDPRPSDLIRAEMALLFDRGEGVPWPVMARLRAALKEETTDGGGGESHDRQLKV